MSSTASIREEMLIMYPQAADFAEKTLDKLLERNPESTLTMANILDKFIDKAKKQHNETAWGNKYDEGVTLLTLHFLEEAQPAAVNSGLIVKEKHSQESETEYMRPSLSNFGKYSTTKYGRAWEALKSSIVFYTGPSLL